MPGRRHVPGTSGPAPRSGVGAPAPTLPVTATTAAHPSRRVSGPPKSPLV
ncbi:hypothetical protein [Streptomyces olivaceoviridis]